MTSTHFRYAAAVIDGEACEAIWRIVRAELARRQRDGGLVQPSVQQALDSLRAAAQDHLTLQAMFARERGSGSVANIAPESVVGQLVSTQGLADRLDVTPTHARRIAKQEGIEPAARNAWRPTDVDALVANRRTA